MKVSIMTMQRIYNYGSFLQAYALKKILESLVREVDFVDFHIGTCKKYPLAAVPGKTQIKGFVRNILQKIYHIVFARSRKKRQAKINAAFTSMYSKLTEAYKKILKIPQEPRYLTSESDALVIGSDEVFNCLNSDKNVGYSLELFGENCPAGKLISYAASFGTTTYEKLTHFDGVIDEIIPLLKNFDAISVRDANSVDIISRITGVIPNYNLDPVLIYPFEKELAALSPPEDRDYIIVYAYPARISRREEREIRAFARKKGKKIIALSECIRFNAEFKACTPFEVLNYFKNAEYVITDTFHGAVMSIKYNIPFAAFVRGGGSGQLGNTEKLYDLLNRFSLTGRIVREVGQLGNILTSNVDFNGARILIEKERAQSLAYLTSALDLN